MNALRVSFGPSRASINLKGAHVTGLWLQGEEVVKPCSDGVPTHGGIAVLIPYAGRVRGGSYDFEGRRFRLPVGRDGHAIHGFAKDSRWEVAEKSERFVVLRSLLKGEGYPGVLDSTITYSVRESSFSTKCAIKNVGHANCPLVVGFHPYLLARDWRIIARGNAHRYELEDGYFPTGERATHSFEGIGPLTRLDNPFKVSGTITLRDADRSLTITRRRMPYLVLYNGRYAEGRSVAIEPYTGLPDAYNNGIGLLRLKSGEVFDCAYEMKVSLPKARS